MSLQDIMAADLKNVFFNPEEFGTTATYNPEDGAGRPVNGLFERETITEQGVATYHTTFECASSDVAGASIRDVLTIDGTKYLISAPPEIRTDGTALLTLEIETDE